MGRAGLGQQIRLGEGKGGAWRELELWHEGLMVLEGCSSARDSAPKQEEQERMTWIALHPLPPISCKWYLLETELSQHPASKPASILGSRARRRRHLRERSSWRRIPAPRTCAREEFSET